MKRALIISSISLFSIAAAHAASTPWWLQPTVCRLNPSTCYPAMGTGYDPEMWDSTSNCWGMKIICAHALTNGASENVAIPRSDIARNYNISKDYDTDLLYADDECFGRRKTVQGGKYAMVNNNQVRVFCNGVWANADEQLSNGEIETGTQPTCQELARDGYAAVENGDCFGKYYDTTEYHIECGTKIDPTQIIILNGADFRYSDGANYPLTARDADKIFDTMYDVSSAQKKQYFNN